MAQEADVLLEGGGIHGHEHVAGVAGGVYVFADAHLEAADAAERALRSTDFGGIVRECGHAAAECRRHICEDITGQLHAVAGVAGEADDYFIKGFDLMFFRHKIRFLSLHGKATKKARYAQMIFSDRGEGEIKN